MIKLTPFKADIETKAKSAINSLSVKIFALFWLVFGLLLLLAFFIPSLDARLYKQLDSAAIKFYHQEIINAIRDKHFVRVLLQPENFILDKGKTPHPILVDKKRNIIGASHQEIPAVREFAMRADDSLQPKRKTFDDFSLAGPFAVHLHNDSEEELYSVYFINYGEPQEKILNFIFDHPVILILLLLLISTPMLAWLATSLARPIKRFQHAANAVAQGNFSVNRDLENLGVAELRQVGKSFNHMAQSLDDLLSTHQKWLSAVSHELRTPLTRLQLASALIRRKLGDSAELQRIDNEIERMNKMVGDLLLVSRNQIADTLQRERINLPQIWKNVLDGAYFEASQMGLSMKVNMLIGNPSHYWIEGNLEGLESAVENVIRNALKYTKSAFEVTFSVAQHQLWIAIDDNGAGLEEEEYSRIFTPFYRVDENRTRETGGVGLGLALVQATIRSHRGNVWAEKSHLGGLRVMIMLPLLNSPSTK